MATIYLKLSGPEESWPGELRAVHATLLGRDVAGNEFIGNHSNADFAVIFYPQLTLAPVDPDTAPETAGPHLMIKILGDKTIPDDLPPGLTKQFEAGGAPVKFLGDDE